MPSKTHTGEHKYKRVKLSTKLVYRCVKPGCSHYKLPSFIIGALAECWYCGKDFVINHEMSRRERVHCSDCTEKRDKKIKPIEVVSFLEEIANEST